MTLLSTTRRQVPVATAELLSRLGRAKVLARDYNVTHPKYAPTVWEAHIASILQASETLAAATAERSAFGLAARAVLPQAQHLAARLRQVIGGQLPPGHADLVTELAQPLQGRAGRVVDRLATLVRYCRDHADMVPLSADLLAQPFDDIIAELRAHDPDQLTEKRAAEQAAAEQLKQLENTAWYDLKQVRAFAQAEYEAGEAAVALFADLSKVERSSTAPVAAATEATVATPTAVAV